MSLLTLVLAVLLGLAPDDALVAEFKVYYGKDKQPGQRKEAVLTLEGADSPAAVRALLKALEDEEFLVQRAAVDVLAGYRSEPSARVLVDEVLLNRKAARKELLLAGAAEAAGGSGQPFVREPIQTLVEHKELVVRLGALAGLGRLKDPAAVPVVAARVSDRDPAVAVAALRALGAIGDPSAEEAVLAGLVREEKAVTLEAIRAIAALRLKGGVRPLIELMRDHPDPRVTEDAYEALTQLTQRRLEDDAAVWLAWWDRNEPTFELPDLEKILAAREQLAREGGKYSRGTSFSTIPSKSEHVIFVIDVSQSMEEPFGDLERLARSGRAYASDQRLEIVKEELILTIEELPDTTNFNIIAFATDVEAWKDRLQRANVLNKNNAVRWVGELEPKGGAAANFASRMGLSANAGSDGMTNTYLALMSAFGEEVGEKKRKSDRGFVTASKEEIDTIFFLTDGEPTVGETVDMIEIREEVRRVNAFRGVKVHVIYVGAYGGKEFKLLAEQNDGVFVSIGG